CATAGCAVGGCAPTARTVASCRVWVANLVQKPETYTCNEIQQVEVPYTYQVTLCKPETRTQNVQVCEMISTPETYQFNVSLTRNETRNRTITVCEMVPTPETYQYNVALTRNETR